MKVRQGIQHTVSINRSNVKQLYRKQLVQTRPLQYFNIACFAFKITRQYDCRFLGITAWHHTVYFNNAAELAQSINWPFLHQKVGVVLDAHGPKLRHTTKANP